MSKFHCFCLSLCCFLPSIANAVPVTITNPSFEQQVVSPGATGSATGWTLSGTGGGGVWNYGPGTTYFDVSPPDGNQVGFLSSGPTPEAPRP